MLVIRKSKKRQPITHPDAERITYDDVKAKKPEDLFQRVHRAFKK
jgi:hypothetical protein